MRYLQSLIIFLALPLLSQAQDEKEWGIPYNQEKESIIYEAVIDVAGASKAELYERAIAWINTYYTAGANKITTKSKEEGILELKDRLMFYKMHKKSKVTDVIIDYNLTIWFKDGRFKYQITNFRAFQGSTSPHIEQWMQARYSDPDIAMERFSKLNIEIEKLVENMTSNLSNNKQKDDDDW
ncbi:MAG: DUF4468 domain-containing protein [Bacteroidetes bacterium]|jgi:hypothetical protein|nr:DUF4468 domain-containing protein [Bacteroidota bacterium]MBT5530329.1 DUF4468 domain-containing protein [Cytophagia bacterium]MBT3421460.1 DUF4468 domain-containing protein [Bacteroidota bacterium]MBT4730178.1 DUF4468 domain-containing protein [Bacteroidota bacterium]MBT4968318.1 DUF4468 domain-containing protein [Bacteroidota bacterium]